MSKRSVSIIIPALNEALNLEGTVKNVQETVPEFFDDWEILLFNDGSTDETGRIADRLAKVEPRIRVTHHPKPKNLGGCYKAGIAQATKEFLILIPGDNECGVELMKRIFALAGTADMIIPYTVNPEVRPLGRRLLSRWFVSLVNGVTGQSLRYYNGTVLHRTPFLKDLDIRTNGFGYQAEILIKLLHQERSYREVGTEIAYRPFGKSKAIRPTSLMKVMGFFGNLAWMRLRGGFA